MSPKPPHYATIMSTIWMVCQKKAFPICSPSANALGHHWSFNWDRVLLWSHKMNIQPFDIKWSRCVGHRTKDGYKENHLIPSVKYGGGSVLPPGCFSSKGPGCIVLIRSITDSRTYRVISNQSLAASDKRLKLGH